jgi:hypothetical protein
MFNFKKKPILKYESSLKTYPDTIKPAKNHIPDWYKKIPMWKDNKMFVAERGVVPTVKLCVPFLDSLTLGYMISLPYDLQITTKDGRPIIVWPGMVEDAPGVRNQPAHEKLIPHEHYPVEFIWNYCVAYGVPKGYSGIITHPLNRHDLPFTTLTGVFDGGLVMHAHGSLPFYIKKGFEGLIPQGTPIAQIIPFRQEDWTSKKVGGLVEQGDVYNRSTGMVFKGWYKNTFWKKKSYE